MSDPRERVTARGRPAVAVELRTPEPVAPAVAPLARSTQEHAAPQTDLVGKQWKSQYYIDTLLAEGGMGEVWIARSQDLESQPVVVKAISSEHGYNRESVDRLFREARAIAAIDDPNVVQILDTGRLDDGRPVLVMEYVEGASIEALVGAEGRLSLERICKHMLQSSEALAAAHAKGIIHRDVKPSNLIVTEKWGRRDFIKLIDFGIAKSDDPELAGKMRTRSKAFVGTAGFAAPEQALGKPIDAKVDIYALGVVLYYELTGRMPYQADSFIEVVGQQINAAPFPAPIELRPDTPLEWNQLALDCIQRDPTRRPTAVEFAHRIARGWPDGKALLRVLAPKIAIRGPAAPHAATMPGDVANAFTRLSALHTVPAVPGKRRLRSLLALLAAALCGAFVAVIAQHAVSPTDAPAAVAHTPPAAAPPSSDPGTQSSPAAGSAAATAPVDANVVSGVTASPDAAGEMATTIESPPAPPPPAPPPPAGSAAERAGSSARPTPSPRTAIATLVIRAKPWAKVSIDGALIGETPVRRQLKPGTYKIRLEGPNGQSKVVSRTVGTGSPEPVYVEFEKP